MLRKIIVLVSIELNKFNELLFIIKQKVKAYIHS